MEWQRGSEPFVDMAEEGMVKVTLLVRDRLESIPRGRKDLPAKQSVDGVRRMECKRLLGVWVEHPEISFKVSLLGGEKVTLVVASHFSTVLGDYGVGVEWQSTSLLNRQDLWRLQFSHNRCVENLMCDLCLIPVGVIICHIDFLGVVISSVSVLHLFDVFARI